MYTWINTCDDISHLVKVFDCNSNVFRKTAPASNTIPLSFLICFLQDTKLRRNCRHHKTHFRIDYDSIKLYSTPNAKSRLINSTRSRGIELSSEELLQYLLEDHGPNCSSNEQNAGQQPTSTYNTRAITATESNTNSNLVSQNATGATRNALTLMANDIWLVSDESRVAESLREMTNRSLCRICTRKTAVIALTPCGHLAMCEDCSTNATRCVVCNSRIQEKLKVYRA